ncbi:MAG: trigger factor [Prevotella sp.]|nr:trigger factor [Prevotella sp.]
MNIAFENQDKVSGLLTVTIYEEDYKDQLSKSLKDYRKSAVMPGFRPGMVPMQLIQKKYEPVLKLQEVNKLLEKSVLDYLQENVNFLASPVASDKQEPVDLEGNPPYKFMFEVALSPEFEIPLSNEDTLDYYELDIDENLINDEIELYRSRHGHNEDVQEYAEDDVLKGEVIELADDGKPKEGGIHAKDRSIFPKYIKDESQKKLFDGAKPGDEIIFNPKKTYPESDAEIAYLLGIEKQVAEGLTQDFCFKVSSISRFIKSEINQELFDKVFGEGKVKSEEEFREMVSKNLLIKHTMEVEELFYRDVRKFLEAKAGKLEFSESILKRSLKQQNKDKQSEIEEHFDSSLKFLAWQLIKGKVFKDHDIKIEQADIKESAKKLLMADFVQYGMFFQEQEGLLDQYAENMMKDPKYQNYLLEMTDDRKIAECLKNIIKLNVKKVSLEELGKLSEERLKEEKEEA